MQPQPIRAPLTLFYSYAHEDAPLREQLEKHLSPLHRQGLISQWHDRQIVAGTEWIKEIDVHMEAASIILLLISSDFLASDYCYSIEMQRALERHRKGTAHVIPIILRPCEWYKTPFAHMQVLPRDGKPVTAWNNQDAAFLDITRGICRAIERRLSVRSSFPLSSVDRQNRQRLLKRVRQTWIEGILEQSSHQEALIALDLQDRPDVLDNPWHLEVQETNQPPRSLPAGTSIVQVYDHADGELLILGEPGAGKTTLLLELTKTLLERAEREEREPMPIVFNLSSWAVKRQPLTNWLREELRTKYQIPYEISQMWLHTDRILALLDGLDEVAKDAREQCVRAINIYHQRHLQRQGVAPLVVCSRSEEYMALPTRVTLRRAVAIQPLTDEQIENYLQSTHSQLDGLKVALHQDPELCRLARQPFMLSIFTLAYQGAEAKAIPTQGTSEALQQQVFAAYVERMLRHRSVPRHFSREDLLRQLIFIAAQMQQHQQTVLYLENLQPDWLLHRSRRLLYRLMIGLVAGLVAAFLYCLTYIPVYSSNDKGYAYGLLYGLGGGSILGVFFGLFVGLVYGLSPIRPIETFTRAWRWTKQNASIGVTVGLLVGWVIELSQGFRYSPDGGVFYQPPIFRSVYPTIPGLSSALLASLLTGLAFGFHTNKLDNRARLAPNQGIWRSARNGLIFSLVIGLFLGLGSVLLYVMFKLGGYISVTGVVFGMITGLSVGLNFGLGAFLQHFTLRFWLWCSGNLSWNLIPLLDEATHRILLRKVGGGYIFIHRLLLDYFAGLEKDAS